MAYDETEDPEALLRFYNFGSMSEQDFEAATADTTLNNNDELILASGERLGHRRFMRYFKQRLRRPSEDETDKPLSIAEAAAQNGIEIPEPRNRKERRRLALTDGRSLNRAEMLRRLPEIVQKQDYQRQTSMRNNRVATSRLRIQNPI
jgi:pre-60S factor REI1